MNFLVLKDTRGLYSWACTSESTETRVFDRARPTTPSHQRRDPEQINCRSKGGDGGPLGYLSMGSLGSS